MLSIRVCAQARESEVRHLRTTNSCHEVDPIVARPVQLVIGVEVKLARTVDDEDVKPLLCLAREIGDDLLHAIVITTGPQAYRRGDGIE